MKEVMSKFSEVSRSCEALYSTKLSEQTKGLNELRRLLDDDNVVLTISKSHEAKKIPSWNTICEAIIDFLKKECGSFTKSYSSWSATSRTNKTTKLGDLLNFLQKVVRIAVNGCLKVEISPLIAYLIELWNNEIFVANFGNHILKIINDVILGNRKVTTELSKAWICTLLHICEREMNQYNEKRKHMISSVLLSVTKVIVRNLDFSDHLQFHDIFLACVKCLENVQATGIIENVISAVNLYLNWSSTSHRELSCAFGESCLDLILQIWRKKINSDSSIQHFNAFFAAQVSLHHPQMSVDVSTGFYAKNLETWCSQLYNILVAADMILCKHRFKDTAMESFNSGSVMLAGDACCVIFKMSKVGHSIMPKNTRLSCRSFVKNINFDSVKSIITMFTIDHNGNIDDLGRPWLAILKYLLENHNEIFENDVLKYIMIKFHHLLMNACFKSLGSNSVEIVKTAFMLISSRGINAELEGDLSISSIWKDCWNISVACLATDARDAVACALKLLETLIEFDLRLGENFIQSTGVLKSVATNFWSTLYLRVTPNHLSISLVIKFVQAYGISCQDNDVFSSLLQTTSTNSEYAECDGHANLYEKTPVKILLLHWLLGYKKDDAIERQTSHSLRLTQQSQLQGKHKNTAITCLTPNVLSKNGRTSKLVVLLSELLVALSYKNSRGSANVLTQPNDASAINDIVDMFLKHEAIVSFQHFKLDSFKWLQNERKSENEITILPQCDASSALILGILSKSLETILSNVEDVHAICMLDIFSKLCQTFFLYGNVLGNFLKYCNKLNEFPLKYYKIWICCTERFIKSCVLYLQRDYTKIKDDDICELTDYLNTFLEILTKINNSQVLRGNNVISENKFRLNGHMHTLFQIIHKKFKSEDFKPESAADESPSSHDELLGLTQSMQPHGSVGHGYKRRKYGDISEPPSKQSRLSSSSDASMATIIKQDNKESDLDWDHPYIRNVTRLALTTFTCLKLDGPIKTILDLAANLKAPSLPDLRCIYTIINQISSFCGLLTSAFVNDVLNILKTVFGTWYKDQEISLKFLVLFSKIITSVASQDDFDGGILRRISEMQNIFWNLKLANKSSYLARMGIATCLFANMQHILKGNHSALLEDQFDRIIDILSDTHGGVRCLTSALLAGTQLDVHKSWPEKYRRNVLSFASKLASQASGVSTRESAETLPLLSTALYCIVESVTMPLTSNEVEAHYLLCVITSLMQKYTNSLSYNGVCQRCMTLMAERAYGSAYNFDIVGKTFLVAYKTRHLMTSLHQWLVSTPGSLTVKIELFPCSLFGYDDMKSLCQDFSSKAFPAIFCSVRSHEDLTTAYDMYFSDDSSGDYLQLLLENCLPEILQLLHPNDTLNAGLSEVLDDLYQKNDCYRYLLGQCLGPVVVDLFMESKPDAYLESTLQHISKITQTASTRGKLSAEDNLSIAVSDLIFGKQKCPLIDIFTRVRFHFENAWFCHEYKKCTQAYCKFVLMLLTGSRITEKETAYLVGDVISVISINLADVEMKLEKVRSTEEKNAFIESVNRTIELLTKVCSFLVENGCSCLNTGKIHNIAVLIINLLLSNRNFCEVVNNFEMASVLSTTQQNFTAVVKKLSAVDTFKSLYAFTDNSENYGAYRCVEALKESYRTVCSLDILKFHNPIIDTICQSLVSTLSAHNELSDEEERKALMGLVPLLINVLKAQKFQNLFVMNAVIKIYSHVSKMIDAEAITAASDKDVIFDILETLFEAVTCKSSDISFCASSCVAHLVNLSDMKVPLQTASSKDSHLSGILLSCAEKNLRVKSRVPRMIDHLETDLPWIETISDRNLLSGTLTSCLIDFCHNPVYHAVGPICRKIDKICRQVLPHVIHDILVHDPTQRAKQQLSKYFQTCFTDIVSCPVKWADSMCSLLDVVQYLRTQPISKVSSKYQKQGKTSTKVSSWHNNFWLDVNYLDVAKVAAHCRRPYMAIQYAEIWKESLSENFLDLMSPTCRSLSKALNGHDTPDFHNPTIDARMQNASDSGEVMDRILIEAYCKIEDVDSLLGLAGSTWNDSLMTHIHKMENNWFEALEDYDMLMSNTGSTQAKNGIIESLKNLGLGHVVDIYQKWKSPEADQELKQKHLGSVLKAGKWDDESPSKPFSDNVERCLSFLEDQHPAFDSLIYEMERNALRSIPNEITKQDLFGSEMLDCVGKLTIIHDLVTAIKLISKKHQLDSEGLAHQFSLQPVISSNSLVFSWYPTAEPIILNKNAIIEILSKSMLNLIPSSLPQDMIRENMLSHIDLANGSHREKLALRLISTALEKESTIAKGLPCVANEVYSKLQLRKAEVLWNVGKNIQAISVLAALSESLLLRMNSEESEPHCGFYLAKTLQLTGKWKNLMKMENPSRIVEHYFKKSVEIASSLEMGISDVDSPISQHQFESLRISGYKTLAKFADLQYREVIEYMSSKEFEHKRNLAREAKLEISKATTGPQPGQNQKYMVLLQKNSKLDHQDFNHILEKRESFLLCAVENYVKCLSMSDNDDLLIYRICALWFENTQSTSLPGLMQCSCSEIKSHKFVDMSYQLAARLNNKSQDKVFQCTLRKLLKRMAVEHPHHVLPVLYALAYAHRDMEISKSRQKKVPVVVEDATSESALMIINEVKKVEPKLVAMMGKLSDAYIEFANFDVSRYAKTVSTPISFEKSLLITKFCDSRLKDNYSSLVIPTIDIPVIKSGDYKDVLHTFSLSYFKSHFQLCGGINLPKIVVALSSDGKERKHLVKGRDDLRQDAVMQHVFKVVNALLAYHEGAQNLKMCTYKVVPLSQRSGLVEWCEGTIPIGNYLIGVPAQRNYGAHHLYRPTDLISIECRKLMHSVSGKAHSQKLQVYQEVCKKFKPVFRHFFYENFVIPSHWFMRRTAYCKSVSISSIVGYILGLGDRHVQNILIDRTTGEVIHIDLGVAFEQGKCLPTPEMVPFRLTRDIVDALGSHGVEGIFRRNCERCLKVMRISVDVISTIVEVLLHDPLHDWMMTSNKAMQVQRDFASNIESDMTASVLNASTVAELLQNEAASAGANSNQSSLAARALLRVKEKLRGLEFGSVLSVEGQVNTLIQQATDEEKLCAMFAGWQAYI